MSLQEKYNTKGAALYRDKIATEAKGEIWSADKSPARSWVPPVARTMSISSSGMGNGSSSGSSSVAGCSEVTFGNGMTVTQVKKETENYFARVQAENASRPDNLPPSQGGKYGGFGSGGYTPAVSQPVRP